MLLNLKRKILQIIWRNHPIPIFSCVVPVINIWYFCGCINKEAVDAHFPHPPSVEKPPTWPPLTPAILIEGFRIYFLEACAQNVVYVKPVQCDFFRLKSLLWSLYLCLSSLFPVCLALLYIQCFLRQQRLKSGVSHGKSFLILDIVCGVCFSTPWKKSGIQLWFSAIVQLPDEFKYPHTIRLHCFSISPSWSVAI